MKKTLGAITAALLLGAGCAHNQGKQTETSTASSPQASVDNSAQWQTGGAGNSGLDCAVIGTRSSGSQTSTSMNTQSNPGAVSGGVQQNDALGGSASGPHIIEGTAIGSSGSEAGVSQDTAIGGSAFDVGASEDIAAGSQGAGAGVTDDTDTQDTASQADTFEDTGMGGAGGGGG